MTALRNVPPKPMSLPPSTPVSFRIGAYRPCLEIGSGGMANVYIAKELGGSGFERTVTLKVMHEHLANQEPFRKRFLDEARVLTHISHPYVCRVLGFGQQGQRPYMVMEYLVGEPLSRVVQAATRNADRTSASGRARIFARIVADLAEGLHAAHETRDANRRALGIIHRDVTPHNLFVLYDGTVRVLDFGIARYRGREVQTTATGHLVGKLPYMAPEQLTGELYDRRADIWSLGVVLWELMTLGHLFRRKTPSDTLQAVCSDPVPSVYTFAKGVPDGLDRIIAHALERDPSRRYATASVLARELEVWLARTGGPVTHAEVSEFLQGSFPGSEQERRRWAEATTPRSGVRLAESKRDEDEIETAPYVRPGTPVPKAPSSRRGAATTFESRVLEDTVTLPVEAPARDLSSGLATEITRVTKRGRRSLRPGPDGRHLFGVSSVIAVLAVVLAGALFFIVRPEFLRPLTRAEGGRANNAMFVPPGPGVPRLQLSDLKWSASAPATKEKHSPRRETQQTSREATGLASESGESAVATGDLLVVNAKPGSAVRVYMGDRLLGTTPVRARVPAGMVALGVEPLEGGARMPMPARIIPGRVNMFTVGLGN